MESVANNPWLWLESSPVAVAIRQAIWLYPIIEIIHLLAVAILVGSVVMFDLRLLGCSRHLRVTDLAWHLLPWSYLSFGLVALSGLLLFAVAASEVAANPAFQLKLGLILTAGMNAVYFHARTYPTVQHWNLEVRVPRGGQVTAGLSLLLWFAIVACGRLIAYV